jgi:hypothetical protein
MPSHSKAVRFHPMLILACLICALWGVSNAPVSSQPDDLRSFRSVNFGDRYMRHRRFFGYVDKIEKSDTLGRSDATFRLVPGLAGRCSSFESVNVPNHFLRHRDFRVSLSPRADDELFKNDATFCLRSGLFNSSARSFESFNRPGHYIRHSAFELWLEKSDGTLLFKKDASFFMERPLTHSFPQPFGEPNQIPSPPE